MSTLSEHPRPSIPSHLSSTSSETGSLESSERSEEWSAGSEPASVALLDWALGIAAALLLIAAAALNPLDQSDAQPAGSEKAGINAEVSIKLVLGAAVTATAVLGLIARPRTRAPLSRMPGILLVSLGGVFLATSVVAFEPAATVSRAAAIITCTYIGFMAVAVTYLSVPAITRCLLIGLTLHMVAAWLVYWTGGAEVVYQEELGKSLIVDRMGSTAHPNSLGRIGTLSCMLCLAIYREKGRHTSLVATILLMVIVLMGLATLSESMSRTAMAAGIAGIGAMVVDRFTNPKGIAIVLLGAAVTCAAVIAVGLSGSENAVGSGVISAGTKTGDISELTSATGRNVIWAEATSLIAERPLTGWGLVAAPILLEDFSFHTHNLILHVVFSAGLLAGVIAIALLLWTFIDAITSGQVLLRGIAGYILVSGFFEDSVFETFPFTSTLLWMTVLLMPSEGWSTRTAKPDEQPTLVPA